MRFHCQRFIWAACCWQRSASYAKFTAVLYTTSAETGRKKKPPCGFYLYTWNGQRMSEKSITRTFPVHSSQCDALTGWHSALAAKCSDARYRFQRPEWVTPLTRSEWPCIQIQASSSAVIITSQQFVWGASGSGPLLWAGACRSDPQLFQPLQLMWQCAV